MSRAPWVAHFGFTRTPFSKSIATKDLYCRPTHDEAVARISFCVAEAALGVIVGDVPSFRSDQMPYGGTKDSGRGREGLRYAMDEMTEPRILVLSQVPL